MARTHARRPVRRSRPRLARPRLPRPNGRARRRARRVDAPTERVLRRVERVRTSADERAAPAARGVRAVRGREGATRSATAPHAGMGAARLRPRAEEEEVEGRQEDLRRTDRAAAACRQALRAVGAAARSLTAEA